MAVSIVKANAQHLRLGTWCGFRMEYLHKLARFQRWPWACIHPQWAVGNAAFLQQGRVSPNGRLRVPLRRASTEEFLRSGAAGWNAARLQCIIELL